VKIRVFRALRPEAGMAREVACVPYDTVDTEEARALVDRKPWSFLRVVRPDVNLPSGADMYKDEAYDSAAENFARFREKGILLQEEQPCLYVYRQQMGKHVQRGVVACCHIGEYANGVIKRHERIRDDRKNDRIRLLKTLGADTGPVFLTYRDEEAIDRFVAGVEKGEPLFDFRAHYGIRHSVWRVPEAGDLISAFARVPVCYVADGHHRAAAAAAAGAERAKANPSHTGEEEYNWFLSVLFPSSQLQILPYNRCVTDLNGADEQEFMKAVASRFRVEEDAGPAPQLRGHVGMYLGGRWYRLSWDAICDSDPVTRLDVSVLQNRLLGPVLGAGDPTTDKRIEFIGGIRGAGELVRRVDTGKAAVAFSLYPVDIKQIMTIADSGRKMPPKSTWFEPKLKSGLVVHLL